MAAATIPRPVLVLDLDNTLLHTIPAVQLAPGESYLLRRPPPTKPGQQNMFFDMAETHGYLTKLRPFVRTFLREAGAMYDLRICTMGTRAYAHHMARLLDPDGALFSPAHIVGREDLKETDMKGLDDAVPGGDARAVVILDDTVEVWEKHLDNLVAVRPYDYFAGRWRRGKSFAQMRMDEEDQAAGGLAKALGLLRRAHEMLGFRRRRQGGVAAPEEEARAARPAALITWSMELLLRSEQQQPQRQQLLLRATPACDSQQTSS